MNISFKDNKDFDYTSPAKGKMLETALDVTSKHIIPKLNYPADFKRILLNNHSNVKTGENIRFGEHPDIDHLNFHTHTLIEDKNYDENSQLKPERAVVDRFESAYNTRVVTLNKLNPDLHINDRIKRREYHTIFFGAKQCGFTEWELKELQKKGIVCFVMDQQFLPKDPITVFKVYQERIGVEIPDNWKIYHIFKDLSARSDFENEKVYAILKEIFPSHLFNQFEKLVLRLIRYITLYSIGRYYRSKYAILGIFSLVFSLIITTLLRIFVISGKDPPSLLFFSDFCPILPIKKPQKEGEPQMCERQNRVIASLKKQLKEFIGEYETPVPKQNKTCLEMAIEYFKGGETGD